MPVKDILSSLKESLLSSLSIINNGSLCVKMWRTWIYLHFGWGWKEPLKLIILDSKKTHFISTSYLLWLLICWEKWLFSGARGWVRSDLIKFLVCWGVQLTEIAEIYLPCQTSEQTNTTISQHCCWWRPKKTNFRRRSDGQREPSKCCSSFSPLLLVVDWFLLCSSVKIVF